MRRLLPVATLLLALSSVPLPVVAGEDNACPWRARPSSTPSDTYSVDDISEEIDFGKQVAARILGQHQLVGAPDLQRYISLVGSTLAQHSSRPELKFRFAVVESGQVNAYSTPGGYVFVTTAALKLMKSEAELAGVLAHEISHVCERHLVKDLNIRGSDTSGFSSVLAIIGGATVAGTLLEIKVSEDETVEVGTELAIIGGATDAARIAFTQAVDKAVDVLFKDGYKQADEMQADQQAVSFAALAGYDPTGLESYLNRVAELKAPVGKSYPQYDTRLQLIQKTRAEQGIAPGFGKQGTERFSVAAQHMK